MEKLFTMYGENLLFVFDAKDVKNGQPLAIINDGVDILPIEDVEVKHYSENFESLVTIALPTKNRRLAQMISLNRSLAIIQKIAYGVLSFTYEGVPYSVGLNHVYKNNKLYFHAAKTGFKLHGTSVPVSYLIIDDLGINESRLTHNHESVMLQGRLNLVTDNQEKQKVLEQLITEQAPTNPKLTTKEMVNSVAILEFTIQFLHGKSHIRY